MFADVSRTARIVRIRANNKKKKDPTEGAVRGREKAKRTTKEGTSVAKHQSPKGRKRSPREYMYHIPVKLIHVSMMTDTCIDDAQKYQALEEGGRDKNEKARNGRSRNASLGRSTGTR